MHFFNDDLKEELFEALNFTVNSGYYSEEDIEELVTEYLAELLETYELERPTLAEIKTIISDIRHKRVVETTDNYLKLRAVFDQLNRENIIAVDYAGFDISEGHEDIGVVFQFMKAHDIPRKGYCFYHQQDIERSLDPENPSLHLAFHSLNGDEAQALEVGQRIVELLKEAGFIVLWNQSLNQRITLYDFHWDKIFDQEEIGVERAIRIMKETHLSA